MEVLKAWDFPPPRTVAFYWIKMPKKWHPQLSSRIQPRMGMGYHTRAGIEQCWFAICGRGYERLAKNVEQVVFAPIREHSRKPDEVVQRIERLVGDVPRIELFARAKRPGWTVWGDEVDRWPRYRSLFDFKD